MTSDGELLRRYAEADSEAAFNELVRRHLDLVYSAALRQVNGDAHLAQDVAQSVFIDLARKAASLADRAVLSGWLYTGTHFAAASAVRTERRRHTREQEAQLMHELLQDSAPERDWGLLRPTLDAAMLELDESEREAVLLRYFENRQHAEIADRLSISENAARMRVDRALGKLRALLSARGVTTTAALSAVISANAIHAAPVGLAVTISTAAALAGTTIATTIATATKAIAMTTLQKTLVTATVAVLAGAGIYETRQASQLREQNQTLQHQQAPLAEENVRLKGTQNELLRLRGEIGQLRRQLESAMNQAGQQPAPPKETTAAAGHTPGSYISKDQLAHAGYATPEAAVENMMWLLVNGTYEQAVEWLSPKMLAEERKDPRGREEFEVGKTRASTSFKGIQIVAKKIVADDTVELKVRQDNDPVAMRALNMDLPPDWVMRMVRVGDQWKVDGQGRPYNETWDQEGQVQSFLQK